MSLSFFVILSSTSTKNFDLENSVNVTNCDKPPCVLKRKNTYTVNLKFSPGESNKRFYFKRGWSWKEGMNEPLRQFIGTGTSIPKSEIPECFNPQDAYSENGEDLPEWLVFHERTGILEGVPSEENLGEHYITIEAFDEDHRGSVKDVFALEVLARTSARFSHLKTDCKPTEEKSVISLVLDVHFPTTTAKQKVFILKNLAEFLNVKKIPDRPTILNSLNFDPLDTLDIMTEIMPTAVYGEASPSIPALAENILSGEDGLKKNVPEGIHIKKVSWSGVGHCEAKTTKPAEVPPKAENLPPFPRNQVDYFNATVGQLLVFQVPEILLGDDEKVTNIVTKLMAPEFPVVSSKLTPTGLCQGALTEISISSGAGAGSGAGGSDTVNSDVTAVSHGEHYIIGLVIPALVIAVMLLCAGLVACVLYRRKRTGKMSPRPYRP
ncbi:unnamed protein product [Nesidiocoris tenuis]|uniref:Dystroglycan C-terminal domain-containing protein n=1 Tax=Nesidiocoris tenuis TaxID=355587 RepID=A0A6H5FUL0_9HEMI|nr:unnamed protein product [Nesidiocoris tenuis]